MPIESSINSIQTVSNFQKIIDSSAPAAIERLVESRSRFVHTLTSAMSEYNSTQDKTYQSAPATLTTLVLPRSTVFMQSDVRDKSPNQDKSHTPAAAAMERIAAPRSAPLN
jgi:hypothetical protein